MTNISQLIPIVAKSIADAETLNANFQFLDSKIKEIDMSGLEKTVNKNQPNGYCGLDSNGKVPSNRVDNSSTESEISNLQSSVNTLNSTAIKQSGISKSNNGYLRLSNGIILQWGYFTAPSYRTEKKFTLNTAFTDNNFKIFFQSKYKQSAGDKGSSCGCSGKTKTTFTFYSGFEQSSPTVFYFAIGY